MKETIQVYVQINRRSEKRRSSGVHAQGRKSGTKPNTIHRAGRKRVSGQSKRVRHGSQSRQTRRKSNNRRGNISVLYRGR